MKLRRRLQLIPRIIVKFITFNNIYICDYCKRLHIRTREEFDINEKWAITVSKKCANDCIVKSHKLIIESISKRWC